MGFEQDELLDKGWVVLHTALPLTVVERLRDAIGAHRHALPPSDEVLYTHVAPPPGSLGMAVLMEQWFNAHRRAGPLATGPAVEAARALAGKVLLDAPVLLQDVLMVKHPRHTSFPWHQDFPFWPVDRPAGVILWAPLDPVDQDNGGLVLGTGSHREGIGPAIDLHDGRPQQGHAPILPAEFDEAAVSLAPGDVVMFHPLTWHRSGQNRASLPRRAWSASWLHPSARWSPSRAPRHPLATRLREGDPVGERP
jgi:hypothetical protein